MLGALKLMPLTSKKRNVKRMHVKTRRGRKRFGPWGPNMIFKQNPPRPPKHAPVRDSEKQTMQLPDTHVSFAHRFPLLPLSKLMPFQR